jgi:hypothetical protein
MAGGSQEDDTYYFHRLVRYDKVVAESTQGNDVANLYGDSYNDLFVGTPVESVMKLAYNADSGSAKYEQIARNFAVVNAYDDAAGYDVAYLRDYDPATDNLIQRETDTKLVGEDYVIWLRTAFDDVYFEPAGGDAPAATAPSENDLTALAIQQLTDEDAGDDDEQAEAVDQAIAELWSL